jgi:outer membrane protease
MGDSMRILRGSAMAIWAALFAASPALAQSQSFEDSFFGGNNSFSYGSGFTYESDDNFIELRGGFGAIGIEAQEHVFVQAGSGNHLSLLVWQSVAPMATIGVDVNLPDDWTVKARARAAMSGDSYMQDYDWFGPDFINYSFDNWTHRSQHPNTNLDWYLDASIAIGRNLIVEPNAKLNLNGGLRYTDVQWSAVGGSFVYSDFTVDNPGNNFHAYTGNFADVPAITYRQQLPVLFAGLDAEVSDGELTYRAEAQAGMTFMGLATDHHWMRTPPLRFLDHIKPTPVVALSASATYDFSDNLGAFVEGSVEKVFMGRADAETYDHTTGALLSRTADTGGAELGTISLSAGIKGSF